MGVLFLLLLGLLRLCGSVVCGLRMPTDRLRANNEAQQAESSGREPKARSSKQFARVLF
jgi:hypothetical protein